MGQVPRWWICPPAAATEYGVPKSRYMDSLETLLAEPPHGAVGVVLHAPGIEETSSGGEI